MSIRSIALGLVVLVFLARCGGVRPSCFFTKWNGTTWRTWNTTWSSRPRPWPTTSLPSWGTSRARRVPSACCKTPSWRDSERREQPACASLVAGRRPCATRCGHRQSRYRWIALAQVISLLCRSRPGISARLCRRIQSIAMYVAMPSIQQGRLVAIAYISHSTSQIAIRIDSLRRPILLAVDSLGILVALLGTAFALTVRNSLDRRGAGVLRPHLWRPTGGATGDAGPRRDGRHRRALQSDRLVSATEGQRTGKRADKTKRFIQDLTHELKTPLAGLSGSVYALQDGAQDDERQRGLFIANLKRDSDRLGRLVGRLLEIQKLEYDRLKLVKFDMASLVERVADEFEAEASRLGVAFQLSGDDLDVLADPDKIERVLEN